MNLSLSRKLAGAEIGATQTVSGAAAAPRTYAFLLLDQFTHLAFSCAIEPLRLANYVSDQQLYCWEFMSVGGEPVQSSNGAKVLVDGPMRPLTSRDTLVVIGGVTPRSGFGLRLLSYLRHQHAHGTRIIGICGATTALAQAGLMLNRPCAVHWDISDAFSELHPEVDLIEGRFTVDGIATAAGGAASADLMLHLIAEAQGQDMSGRIADLMIYPGKHGSSAQQTAHLSGPAARSKIVWAALQLMERHMEDPIPPRDIARRIGTSSRQLERHFQRHLKCSPYRHYVNLRLEKACKLLTQTDLSVTSISMACGFATPSQFSRKYREQFGDSPFRHRAKATTPSA